MTHYPTAVKHLLFDNDGTIVDSEIIAVRSMLHLLAQHGFHMDEKHYSTKYPGLLERDILASLRHEYNLHLPHDFLDRLHGMHREVFPAQLRAIKGMPKVFKNVKVPKSMVSNGSVRHVERSLRRVRLRSALDGHIFSAEHVSKPKPEPDVYHHALQALGLQPQDVLVVEDSPTGVVAAKRAGLRVVGFLGASHIPQGHGDRLRDEGADYLAKDAGEVAAVLRKYGAL
jgi:HAD superfamily hydrolase (TIGR01509 family)